MGTYALKIEEIPIGYPPLADDEDGYCGGVSTQEISQSALVACLRDRPGETPFQLTIQDDGEGLYLIITYANDSKSSIVRAHIPDDSIETIVESLRAVLRLRRTE